MAVEACSVTEFDDDGFESKIVTLSVLAENTETTKVSYDTDWAVLWDEADALLAIDKNGNTSKFTMKSYDAASPTFSGNSLPNDYNLIYPYPSAENVEACADIDLTTQSEGAKHTYMISESMISSDDTEPIVTMKHLGATMVLDMKFTGYDGSTIERLEVSGLNSNVLLNANSEFGSNEQLTDITANTITVTDKNTKLVGNEAYALVRFNILPTTLAVGESVRVNVHLKNADGTVEALTKTITNNTGEAIDFGRAKYHTLLCGLSNADKINYDTKWTNFAASKFNGGLGTTNNPYQIATAEQFARLSRDISTLQKHHFVLTHDIDLTGHQWVAVGSMAYKFQGTFDGDSHKITGLYINQTDGYCQALFGYIDGATIKNLSVSGHVIGYDFAAGVVGFASGSNIISCGNNCSVVAISHQCNVGGVVSAAAKNSNITDCYNNGTVLGIEAKVGGIAGYIVESSIENSHNCGSVKSGNNAEVGGIVGNIEGSTTNKISITNCYNKGSVSAGDESKVGGIAANVLNCYITNCHNLGSVKNGLESNTGGISGIIKSCTITNCYNEGSTTTGDESTVGGGVGVVESSIIANSYNMGSVLGGISANIGGIAGSVKSGVMISCYNSSALRGGAEASDIADDATIGGFVGLSIEYNYKDSYFRGCYWDTTTYGHDNGIGSGKISNDSKFMTGKTSEQMKKADFIDLLNNFGNWFNTDTGYGSIIEACAWRSGASGYPILDYGNSPQ